MSNRVKTDRIVVTATINGEERSFLADERDSLLEALRERIGLTGAKEGCNNGNCGACAVILDGRLVNSCCGWPPRSRAQAPTSRGMPRPGAPPVSSDSSKTSALQ